MTENTIQEVPVGDPVRHDREPHPDSRATRTGNLVSWVMARGSAMPAIVSLIAIAVFFQWRSPYFLSPVNIGNLAVQITLVAIIAMGEVVVLLLGEIDLSLGSLVGVTAAILGVLMATYGLPWYVAVPLMIACGAGFGAFQGMWISLLGIPSFVVTLAGLMAFLGLQLWILGPQGTMSVFDPTIAAITGTTLPTLAGWILAGVLVFAILGTSAVGVTRGRRSARALGLPLIISVLVIGATALFNASRGVPTAFLLLLIMLSLGWWITERTVPGRHLFAVGGNAEASRRAGLPVSRIRLLAFTASGMLAAIGGLFAVSYNGSAGTLTGGGTLLLEAIGAAVIGGTSLFGGRGTMWSALFGALIMGGVSNGLDLMEADQPVKYMVQGAIVLLAVSLDTILRRRQSRGRQAGAARA
jgi:D-xylose transport system permease protein